MFSFKEITLRKITIDNGVKYLPQIELKKDRDK